MELLAAITEECPWEFVITRDARQEWAKMDNPYRGHVMKRLLRIAQGYWLQDGNTVCLVPEDKSLTGLEMWRTKFSKSGRIVFEVAVDYSQKAKAWQENLRLWVITMNHDKYEQRIKSIEASYRRARDVNQKLKLEADAREQDRVPCRTQRLPRRFHELTEGLERSPTKAKDESYQEPERCKELRDHMPPASAQKDSYTLLKFYDVSQTLLRTVMKGLDDSEVDFPFRVSPMEQSIIEMNPVPPSSILLLGRSGTGKTTCAVYRIWGHWMTNHLLHSACPYHQVSRHGTILCFCVLSRGL